MPRKTIVGYHERFELLKIIIQNVKIEDRNDIVLVKKLYKESITLLIDPFSK